MIKIGQFGQLKNSYCLLNSFLIEKVSMVLLLILLFASGCIVLGSEISKSLMFSNVRISSNCVIDQCVIMPEVVVGENCRLKKNCN